MSDRRSRWSAPCPEFWHPTRFLGGNEVYRHIRQHRRALEDTYRVGSLRGRRCRRRRVRIGAADPSLTPVAGMVAVTELVERLDVIGRLDATIGPIKQRRRGHTAGQTLVEIAAAQLAAEDFLVGLDRQRADTAGQQLAPVADLAATTAAGLARRLSAGQWAAVETGLGPGFRS
jgi:hypothetical protein